MPIRIDNQVTNALNVPIMLSNNYINRPTAGIFGRLFISIDTYQIFQDRVSGWSLIADAGVGSGNLQSVTDNGNTTTNGIYIVGSGTLSVQSLTNGSVLFPAGGSGQISQDNANFFWDNTNKRLGLGTATPGQRLDVHSSTGVTAQFNGTGVTNATLQLQNAGTSKWTIGNYYNSGNNDFNIYDNVNTTYRAYFTNTGYAIFPGNVIIGSTNRSSSYGFDVYSSAYFRSSIYNLNYLQGSILFAGAGGLINQNNSQFFWDNTNNKLGIGTTSTEGVVTIQGTSAQPPLTGTTANSLLQLVGNLNNQLNIGSNTSAGSYGSYIQSSDNNLAVPYPLNLQPIGGQVLIGTYDGAVASNLIVAQDSSNILAIRRTTNSNTSNSRILFQANNVSGTTQNVGIVECGLNSNPASSYLALYAGTTAVNLKIYENTGNVLIGGTYTDSGQKLQIGGETRSTTYSTSGNSKISENSGSVPAATATTIFSNFPTNGGSFVLVTGKTAAGDWFFDTVAVNNDNSANALSSQNGGGPPVRIYSVSTNNLRLTVATALSSFFCFGLSAKYS